MKTSDLIELLLFQIVNLYRWERRCRNSQKEHFQRTIFETSQLIARFFFYLSSADYSIQFSGTRVAEAMMNKTGCRELEKIYVLKWLERKCPIILCVTPRVPGDFCAVISIVLPKDELSRSLFVENSRMVTLLSTINSTVSEGKSFSVTI